MNLTSSSKKPATVYDCSHTNINHTNNNHTTVSLPPCLPLPRPLCCLAVCWLAD